MIVSERGETNKFRGGGGDKRSVQSGPALYERFRGGMERSKRVRIGRSCDRFRVGWS